MQEHLHVGRRTFKRDLRGHLILFSPILFFFIFGFPLIRSSTDSDNGHTYVKYFLGFTEKYEISASDHPPLLILVPCWWPHKNVAGMKWAGDTWDGNWTVPQ